MERKTCIAMVPCPGLSHLIPIVEFSKRLILEHPNFQVTILIPTLGPPTPSTKEILDTLPPSIDSTILPQVNLQDLPPNIHLATQMKLTVKHSLPSLQQALTSLSSRTHLVALVCDLFSSDALPMAKKFNLLSYFFSTSGATSLAFCLSLPQLDQRTTSEFIVDTTKSVKFPGCGVPFHVEDLPDPVVLFGRSTETYKAFLRVCQRLSMADGVILNTFTDLEDDAIRAMEEHQRQLTNGTPCVYYYPVGPIIQTESRSQQNESKCISWLENQPKNSVLFISFGSGGTLSHDQLNEIAFGLELSGHKFLWVVRVPNKVSSSAYFVGQKDDPLDYLPRGFLERVKGQGLVVPSWAPQVEVLGHKSTGGFLTHCGWSSVLEGVVHGVPMIAWPLFAEQKMNATTICGVLKVAVRPRVDGESGLVKREEVARVIKVVMEGDESLHMRKRVESLSVKAARAMSEHGSSTKALSSLALKLQSCNGKC
uniref:Glycosyltransferase n=1 Tax=Cajanus cajan TaxID=3821 RepID=A0A151TYE3_CAJCA|nr:Hydroquinone glucosyltransferase [Cajanus cajan]